LEAYLSIPFYDNFKQGWVQDYNDQVFRAESLNKSQNEYSFGDYCLALAINEAAGSVWFNDPK
jgi:hypothetical protein